MKLSIIISARNEFPNIVHTCHSIWNSLESDGFKPDDAEIIIVDNCSDDSDPVRTAVNGTTDFLICRGAFSNRQLKVLYDPIAGNVTARNKGVEIAKGEYIFFSDSHMSYGPGTFKRLMQTIDESGGIVHPAVAWMGSYPPSKGMGYSIKLGEEFKGCVDEGTEILTKEGWKKWYEVSMETEFATINRINEKHLEYQKPRVLVIKDFSGEMIHLKQQSCDMLLTPNHRVLYQSKESYKRGSTEWTVKFAENVKGDEYLPSIGEGVVDSVSFLKDEMVALIGWIITEGSYEKDTITITQFKEDGRKKIKKLLDLLDISYCIHGKKKDFKIHQRDSRMIRSFLPVKELTLNFLYKCNRTQLHILFDTLVEGDGTRTATSTHFIQANENTIDVFQILCAMLGKASYKFERKWKETQQHYGTKKIYVVSVKKKKYISEIRVNKEKYEGKVWCPDLKSGTIIIRRNGHVMLTGNTWNNLVVGKGDDWFYVPAMGHCCLGMKREQFLKFREYPDRLRCYGGGELFLDAKWWMMGSCVVTEPRVNVYHLSASRGYSFVHDDYVHNVFLSALSLGADDWAERIYLNNLRKGRPEVLEKLWKQAEEESQEQKEFVEKNRVMTFNDMLARQPWDEMNMKKHGTTNSGMLIYHDTWLELIKQTPHVVEAYEKSKYQKDLDKFINENLGKYVYKRSGTI